MEELGLILDYKFNLSHYRNGRFLNTAENSPYSNWDIINKDRASVLKDYTRGITAKQGWLYFSSMKNLGKVHTIILKGRYSKVLWNLFKDTDYHYGLISIANSQVSYAANGDPINFGNADGAWFFPYGDDVTITIVRNGLNVKYFVNDSKGGGSNWVKTLPSNEDFTFNTVLIGDSQCRLYYLKVYNRALEDDEILQGDSVYKPSKPVLYETFENECIGQSPKNWRTLNGKFAIGEVLDDDKVLSHIKKGTKYLYLKQVTSGYGVIFIPNSVDRQVLEYDFRLLTPGSSLLWVRPDLTNESTTISYPKDFACIDVFTADFDSSVGVGFSSYVLPPAIRFSTGVWYSIRVTKLSNNVRVEVKGGSYGFTYKTLGLGSGNNVLRKGSYLGICMNANTSNITNIKVTEWF